MKNHCQFILALLPFCLSAQSDTTGQHRLIKGIMEYRNELIVRNPEGFKKLYLLDQLWKEEYKDDVDDLLLAVTLANKTTGISAQNFVDIVLMLAPKSFKLHHLITEDIVQTIIDNDDLAMLLNEGVLKRKAPFPIDPENSLYEELAFYKIANGMRVAEIGAGNGMFSLLVGLAYDSLTVYVNDINLDAVNFTSDRINRCRSIKSSNHYFVEVGSTESTELEEYKVDKVIIRNSFHHFSDKVEMLASIRKSISPNGDLYIFDPTIQPGKKQACPKAMKIKKIRKILSNNGFQIIEEKPIEQWGWVIWHCKPVQPD